MCKTLTQDLSVADNERYAVLLHVSASSERKVLTNKTGAMTEPRELYILTHSDGCGPSLFCL